MRAAAGLCLPLLVIAAPVAADDEWAKDGGGDSEGASAFEPDSYPWSEVLNAFATACSGVENAAVNRASVAAAGWEEYQPDADDALGQIVAYGIEAIDEEALEDDESPTEMLPGSTWRMTVADRPLHLALSGVRIDDISSTGCRIYDFDAPQPPRIDALESWAVRTPTSTESPAEGLIKYIWNPGMKPGHMEMEIAFVAPGANPIKDVPLSGLVLTATDLEIEGL